MKTIIIYQSIRHKNTKKIAQAMAEALKAELVPLGEISGKDLTSYDLIGFGSGIFVGKHDKGLLDFIDKLPSMPDKRVFIFATSGMKAGRLFNRFNQAIKKKLEDKGLNIVGEFFCRGWITIGPLKIIGGLNKGRPNKQDLAKAKMFAESLL